MVRLTAKLLLALIVTSSAVAQDRVVGSASVIDGDTLEIHGTRIRLYGIDAPESRQECTRPDGTPWRCGQQAALALSDRIGGAVVSCEPRDRDRYGHTVAICFLAAEDLNRWMVARGWAVAFRRYSLDYVAEEDHARLAGLGLWSSTFQMPWDWRQMQLSR